MRINKFIIYLCFIVLLPSCGDSDNALQPTELTKFDASAEIIINWEINDLDGVGQQYVFLEPLVLENTIVLASRQGVLIVADQSSGEIIKRQEVNAILSAGVGGNDEVIVVATRNGEVVALDLSTLKIIWRQTVESEVLVVPVVRDDLVVIRSADGKILALDAHTGKIRWSYQQVLPSLTLRGSGTPLVTAQYIFTGLENGRLIALSPSNGEVIWDIALAVPKGRSEINRLVDIDGKAELYGQVLYVSSYQGRMAAVDVKRGQFLWTRPFSSNTGVTIDAKAVYSTDELGHIWSIDRFSGATLWKQEKLQARDVTRTMIAGEYLLVGDYAGYVHVLSRFDGRFIARLEVNAKEEIEDEEISGVIVPPMNMGKDILVTTRDGSAYSLSIKQRQK